MGYLHLCLDHNFIERSRDMFERYYSGENIFLINKRREDFKIIKNKENFFGIPYGNSECFNEVWDICLKNDISVIVLHGMSRSQKNLIEFLFTKRKFKVYWIFWGYEMYQTLAFKYNYKLTDEKFSIFKPHTYLYPNNITYKLRKLINKAYIPDAFEYLLPYIDYFCFWNYYDYELLCRYFKNKIKYKYFNYGGICDKNDVSRLLFPMEDRTASVIMINHQASQTGNHKMVMDYLSKLDAENRFFKMVPLSYGSSSLRKYVLKLGNALFKDRFIPVKDYLPVEEYYKMLSKVDVAIFGQTRQEAAGNIIHLLRNGVKIFLRNDNSLLQYYRSKGFLVFSFEDDLKSISDLKSLTMTEKERNRKCYLDNISYCDDFMPNFFE